jgi:hypothetical protein
VIVVHAQSRGFSNEKKQCFFLLPVFFSADALLEHQNRKRTIFIYLKISQQLKDSDWQTTRIEFTNLTDMQFDDLSKAYGSWSKARTSVLSPSRLGADFVY